MSTTAGLDDPELRRMIAQEELLQNVKRVLNICWDKCIDSADSYLSSRQESCLSNCTERYVDAVVIGTNLLNNRITGGAR